MHLEEKRLNINRKHKKNYNNDKIENQRQDLQKNINRINLNLMIKKKLDLKTIICLNSIKFKIIKCYNNEKIK